MLAPVLDPFNGAPEEETGGGNGDFFGIEYELGAKAAANIGSDDSNAIFIESKHLHDEKPGFMRQLRRTPDRQHIELGLVVRHQSSAFDRMGAAAMLLERDLQSARRRGNRGISIPVTLGEIDEKVSWSVEMNAGCAFRQSVFAIGGGRQVLNVDIDECYCVLSDVAALGDNQRDGFAHKRNLF